MKITVSRRYHFTATHSLPHYPAPWNEPHGHEYTVEVMGLSDARGALDTDRLDAVWADLAPVNDSDLNVSHALTTVEALAAEWLDAFRERVPMVCAVAVYEDMRRCGRAELDS